MLSLVHSQSIRLGISKFWLTKSVETNLFGLNFEHSIRIFLESFFLSSVFNSAGIACAGILLKRGASRASIEIFVQDAYMMDFMRLKPRFRVFQKKPIRYVRYARVVRHYLAFRYFHARFSSRVWAGRGSFFFPRRFSKYSNSFLKFKKLLYYINKRRIVSKFSVFRRRRRRYRYRFSRRRKYLVLNIKRAKRSHNIPLFRRRFKRALRRLKLKGKVTTRNVNMKKRVRRKRQKPRVGSKYRRFSRSRKSGKKFSTRKIAKKKHIRHKSKKRRFWRRLLPKLSRRFVKLGRFLRKKRIFRLVKFGLRQAFKFRYRRYVSDFGPGSKLPARKRFLRNRFGSLRVLRFPIKTLKEFKGLLKFRRSRIKFVRRRRLRLLKRRHRGHRKRAKKRKNLPIWKQRRFKQLPKFRRRFRGQRALRVSGRRFRRVYRPNFVGQRKYRYRKFCIYNSTRFTRFRIYLFVFRFLSILISKFYKFPVFFRVNLLFRNTTHFYLSLITTRLYYRYILMDIINPVARLGRAGRGFIIRCKGRFTRAQMAVIKRRRRGSPALSDLSVPLDYAQRSVVLKYGTCNVKIWLRY